MEIFLSKQCESLTGSLGRGFGYYIRSTKTGRFFGQRSKHSVPPDGHWRFIVACAELAQNKLHIADIRVRSVEIADALSEAGLSNKVPAYIGWCEDVFYNAAEVLKLKQKFSLSIASGSYPDIKN